MSGSGPIALALHGGAGPRRPDAAEEARVADHLRGLVEAARERLQAGAPALDVVVETVAGPESSGLCVAGRARRPTRPGATSSTPA